MALNLSDEYTVVFEAQPFGMTWSSRKSDNRSNLYVSGVEKNSVAFYAGVYVGSKVLKFGNQVVEDLGAKEIVK